MKAPDLLLRDGTGFQPHELRSDRGAFFIGAGALPFRLAKRPLPPFLRDHTSSMSHNGVGSKAGAVTNERRSKRLRSLRGPNNQRPTTTTFHHYLLNEVRLAPGRARREGTTYRFTHIMFLASSVSA